MKLILLIFTLLGVSQAQEFKLVKGKEIALSRMLLGSWKSYMSSDDMKITSPKDVDFTKLDQINFVKDDKVYQRCPEKHKAQDQSITNDPDRLVVFLSGWMTSKKHKYPFFLVRKNSKPAIIFFQKKGGNIFGEKKEMRMLLGPSTDGKRCRLVLNEDFDAVPSKPYRIYKRSLDK